MVTSRPTPPQSGIDVCHGDTPDVAAAAYEPRPARGWDDAAAVVIDGAWGTPPARDVRQMRNVTPGAPPDTAVGRSRVCAAGFSPCYWADTPAHFHGGATRRRGAVILSPACSSCATVFGPFDDVGRCGSCATAGFAPVIGAGGPHQRV
jgi:hypothetical protein